MNKSNLTKFEQKFIEEFLNDLNKREHSIWFKPWIEQKMKNAFSQSTYSGFNAFYLSMYSLIHKIEDPRFATFKQCQSNNYKVQKGAKGIPIQYFSAIDIRTKKEWNDKEFIEKSKSMTPEEKENELKNKKVLFKMYYVFNAKDIISLENEKSFSENHPLLKRTVTISTDEKLKQFEKSLIDNMNVVLKEENINQAFYNKITDTVTIPNSPLFLNQNYRTATLLHELGHATGHESRLNRDLSGTFGSKSYAIEELRAELNSVFMSNTLNLKIDEEQRTNHLKYIDSWANVISEDPKEFIKALNDSLKIKEYMLEKGHYNELFIEKEISKKNEISLNNKFQNTLSI